MTDTPRVLRSELLAVYHDPYVGPISVRAYISEAHASKRCERALRGGRVQPIGDPASIVWCEQCTTAVPGEATLRRQPDGTWR